ncbi:MAG: hypothetical protein K2X11_22600 [Acetobacteraceae bacterium]|nr:hypothetical protein [Acetobacteraceae bacterium]
MLDWFSYSFLRDIALLLRRIFKKRASRLTPEEIIERRQRWKTEIEDEIARRRAKGLGKARDVIIRDLARINDYPTVNEREKGISPWFRAGLLGTYHRGVQIGLGWHSLTEDPACGWRHARREGESIPCETLMLIGEVRFESIEAIDWDGDEYYNFPHLICHFEGHGKMPYERLVYARRKNFNHVEFYEDVVPYAVAKANSKPKRRFGLW